MQFYQKKLNIVESFEQMRFPDIDRIKAIRWEKGCWVGGGFNWKCLAGCRERGNSDKVINVWSISSGRPSFLIGKRMGAHLWRSDQLSLPYQSLTVWLYWFEPYLPGGGRVQYSEAKEKTRCNRQSPWPAFHSLTPLVALFLLLRQQEMPPVRWGVQCTVNLSATPWCLTNCIALLSTAQHSTPYFSAVFSQFCFALHQDTVEQSAMHWKLSAGWSVAAPPTLIKSWDFVERIIQHYYHHLPAPIVQNMKRNDALG